MIESGESLSYSKNYCSVLEKIARLHDIKQNEKHPLIFERYFLCGILTLVYLLRLSSRTLGLWSGCLTAETSGMALFLSPFPRGSIEHSFVVSCTDP